MAATREYVILNLTPRRVVLPPPMAPSSSPFRLAALPLSVATAYFGSLALEWRALHAPDELAAEAGLLSRHTDQSRGRLHTT